MKKLLFILCFSLILQAAAQDAGQFSKIKLKNGAEMTALIVEHYPGDYIKVKLGEGQFSKINYTEIASIHDKNYHYRGQFSLENGFYLEGAYAFMFGKSGDMNELRVGMSLGLTGNFRFNPYLSLGAGVEINALYVNSDYFLLPLYGRVSGSFSNKRVSPYYIVDLGWSSASTGNMLQEDFEMRGGLFIRPEIGIRINKVRIGFGYQNQQVRTSYSNFLWWGGEQLVEEKRMMRHIRLGMSVLF